jgi:hypothetical protein
MQTNDAARNAEKRDPGFVGGETVARAGTTTAAPQRRQYAADEGSTCVQFGQDLNIGIATPVVITISYAHVIWLGWRIDVSFRESLQAMSLAHCHRDKVNSRIPRSGRPAGALFDFKYPRVPLRGDRYAKFK